MNPPGGAKAWDELRALLERTLEATPEERRILLAELARTDPARAAELGELLRADAVGHSPLDAGVAPLLEELAGTGEAELGGARHRPVTGRRLGAWQVGELLGEGGMGAVYAARRADGAFEQQVAIKVLRTSLETPELRARFLLERQLLATLGHPSIVRILDGGVADDELLWFALERVEGRPITRFVREQQVPVAGIVRLILDVCDAVEAAHRRLIVHRDLKPSNILVTADGNPKLLDFGIAKVLESKDGGLTESETRRMTPQYAAPEQILGEPPTTAVDVYALGVVLHELLTGELPHRRTTSSPVALAQEIPRERVTLPSRRAASHGEEGRRIARQLAGDLDAILLKALRAEPEQRYRSVGELAEDLRRFLEGRPVVARGGARAYRLRSFARRHRWGVAASSLVVASLLLGAGVAFWQAAVARRAEAEARSEAETARRVSEFLVDLFKINEPGEARGNAVTARELLDRGAARIEEQLLSQPAVRGRLLQAIGRAYGELGLYEPQTKVLERELDAQSEAYGAESAEAAKTIAALAKAQMTQGEYAEALRLAERALGILERTRGPDDIATAEALSQLGIAHWYLGDLGPARAALERSLEIQENRLGPEHADLGGILNNVAILRAEGGDFEGARQLYTRALRLFERELGEEHPNVARTLNNLAIVELSRGDEARARELHQRALAIRRRILAPDHPEIAESLNNLGEAERTAGNYPAAGKAFEEALAIRERSLGPGHALVGATLLNLGLTRLELGDDVEARALFERSLSVLTGALGAEHTQVGFPLKALGKLDRREGDLVRAEWRLRRAFELLEKGLEPGDPERIDARQAYFELLRELGRGEEAAEKPATGE